MSQIGSPVENQNSLHYELKDALESDISVCGKLALHQQHIDSIPTYGPDIDTLSFDVEYQTPYRLRVCVSDFEKKRWRIPESIVPVDKGRSDVRDPQYDFGYNSNPFSFYITRKEDGKRVFDTTGERLVFKNQYIELSTRLPVQSNIYGFGETNSPMKRKVGERMTLWTRDSPCPEGENLYGAHPFYIELLNGKAHGVLLRNSNAMDVIYQSDKLTYKVTGGILDFYIFLGPTPVDVVEQYSEFIGNPCLVPYWSLGFHQCRWGYETIEKVKEMVDQYKEAEIPLEAAWIDIDYMDAYKVFTFDPIRFPPERLSEFVSSLHENHQKMVAIIDPGVKVQEGYHPYDRGVKEDIFIKRADGEHFVGRVWPGKTVFPDWFHPRIQEYWTGNLREWLEKVPVDGLWIGKIPKLQVRIFCEEVAKEVQQLDKKKF